MAYEWRLFWVGDGGAPAVDWPVAGWEDLEARERALGLRERQPILVSPEGRVDPRLSYVGHPALQRVEGYRMSTRALAVARARTRGVDDRLPGLRIVQEVNRAGRLRWMSRDGRTGESALGRLTAYERMRLFVDGEDGLEPAMLWLTESGLPLKYTSWTKVFERANDRCAAAGLEVFATPKMLRHSMALRMLISLHNALDRRLGLTPAQRLHYEEVYGQVWLMVKDMLGHRSEQVTRDVYLEPVRGLQLESLLGDDDNPVNAEKIAELAERTGLILDAA